MRERVRFRGLRILSLLFADDTVLLSLSITDLQLSLGQFELESEAAEIKVGQPDLYCTVCK